MSSFRTLTGLALALLAACALRHPSTVGDAAAEAADTGAPDRADSAADAADTMDTPEVPTDAGPCGMVGQRCCMPTPRDGGAGMDGGMDGGGERPCQAGLVCSGGMCSPCPPGSAECGGVCTNTTSAMNCGRCGNACGPGQDCVTADGGVTCRIICPPMQTLCGMSCVTVATDVMNCGRCGNACSFPNATAVCAAGTCALGACLTGFADCDMNPANGCEADTRSSATHCGRCGNACTFANAMASCTRGVCALGPCTGRFADCDLNAANGCETNIDSNALHCSGCGVMCSTVGGTPSCARGMCSTTVCMSGRGNCNGMATDGCEVDLNTSVSNCGTCGNACSFPRAAAACAAGACALGSCEAGFQNCNAMPADGCETNITNDPANCGACRTVCSFPNASANCAMARCSLGACSAGFQNCNASAVDGCEVNTLADANNCGGCGTRCSFPNAAARCDAGTCRLGTCNAGFADCDGVAANGCEVNLGTDASNCGTCRNVCVVANGTAACAAGACAVGACNTGFGDCDTNPANGCETDTRSTVTHCGRCGNGCSFANASASCAASACVLGACNANFANCDSMAGNGCETDLRTTSNCGRCGMACRALEVCDMGTCSLRCPEGQTACSGACVFLDRDPLNCGACGTACPSRNGIAVCSARACSILCNSGFDNCDGMLSNGCETDLRTTVAHCGRCGNACSFANASAVCSSSTCSLGACNTGFGNCDMMAGNGCETNTRTVSNCGRCGDVCGNQNATPACLGSGMCDITCNTGFLDCNTDAPDGCEVNGRTLTNCGACGRACAPANATGTCATGTCAIASCNSNFGNCNTSVTDGCETDQRTSNAHCGGCGQACTTPTGTMSNTCTAGVCVPVCATGFRDCDGNPRNGCETDVRTSNTHCGACGVACTTPTGTTTNNCTAGACVPSCATNRGNCDGNGANGCEADLTTSATCGGCGTMCTSTQACVNMAGTYSCSATCGELGLVCCDPGATCTGGGLTCSMHMGASRCCGGATPINCSGSCVNTTTDASNCSACGIACTRPAGTTANTCAGSMCTPTCAATHGNCDSNGVNGCEVDLRITPAHCGGCGMMCQTNVGTSANTCGGAVCSPTCVDSYGDCDTSRLNGCEVRLNTDTRCGGCSTMCTASTTSCQASGMTFSCQACGAVAQPCCTTGTACASVTSICQASTCVACGGAGQPCCTGSVCSTGSCSTDTMPSTTNICCATGLTNCGGVCVDTAMNASHCGMCRNVCPSGMCASGMCVPPGDS
ncbi:MAG: hypothetical protein HY909_16825 [Deltaproteobacteria bacterium]|nr:hypothetical protein [Deltaproteobacteria bacterium]